MSDKLIAVYTMRVYASGKVETIREVLEDNIVEFNPSMRIKQAIGVLEKVTNTIINQGIIYNLNIETLANLINRATTEVADENSITYQSVKDKCTRQLSLTNEELINLLLEFYKNVVNENNSVIKFKKILKENISKNTKNNDLEYINFKFNEIEEKIRNNK